ncbi:ATP-dependent Lon protease [Paracoccus kondratievae]|uniref:ATP-dependent Lon protease n=1 Tax=Paracoccus kondratievae TaxID=135740 RepID=UPI0029D41601|nr:ATP-dependent Lon protease [Paracoccus kondratievae]
MPCLSAQGFPALWGVLMDHPCLGHRRLLLIDRSDGWARSLQGLIRLPGSAYWHPPKLHGIARQIQMIEAAGHVSIDCPKMLDSLLSEFARAVRLMHCSQPPARPPGPSQTGALVLPNGRSP